MHQRVPERVSAISKFSLKKSKAILSDPIKTRREAISEAAVMRGELTHPKLDTVTLKEKTFLSSRILDVRPCPSIGPSLQLKRKVLLLLQEMKAVLAANKWRRISE